MGQEIFEILVNSLDPHNGVIQKIEDCDSDKSVLRFQILWDGGIAFSVVGWPHFGWYYVEKDRQIVSASFRYTKINDKDLSVIQHLIDEVEAGKYNNKKTLKDKIFEIIQQRQLTSYMNKTKWKEFIKDISVIQNLPIMYKTLFDEQLPKFYWTISCDEYFFHMDMAMIEWFKVLGTIEESEYLGRLIGTKVTQHSVKEELERILKKHSIFYEYDEEEKAFVIYGYK